MACTINFRRAVALDKEMLRLESESRKQKMHDLSTAPGSSVDKSSEAWRPPGIGVSAPVGQTGRQFQARPSRCASSRNRNAFSLMKPAASFWS